MNYVSWVAASKVRHRHADLLIVVLQVDANVLLQLLAPTQRRIGRVFVKDSTVEQVLPGVLHTQTHIHKHTHSRSTKEQKPDGAFLHFRSFLHEV